MGDGGGGGGMSQLTQYYMYVTIIELAMRLSACACV